ncbi:MAG TPA: hydrogenase-4 component E [Rhodospirillaceae bacterium]|nr:MAG: hydrogenase-4 component E [Alphaproteobacteria bacterium GWF2_58_20]HAU29766.1 hydrogenase-4 component E [Rhodospirillaceae bacterium]
MNGFENDMAHTLSGVMLLMSFLLLYQRRIPGLIHAFAIQAALLGIAVSWQAVMQGEPHLFITALIVLLFKAAFIPIALLKLIQRLSVPQAVEPVMAIGRTMLFGIILCGLSLAVMQSSPQASALIVNEKLAMALAIVLLGFLIMIARQNAVAQVIGFMSIENGLVLAAVEAKGMPLIVEISVAFSVLVALAVFGLFMFHIKDRFDTLDTASLENVRGEELP